MAGTANYFEKVWKNWARKQATNYVINRPHGKHYYILVNGHYKTETTNLNRAKKMAVIYKHTGNLIEITKSVGVVEKRDNLRKVV